MLIKLHRLSKKKSYPWLVNTECICTVNDTRYGTYVVLDGCTDDTYVTESVNDIAELLPEVINASPITPQWIPCSERLPSVNYDALGNWYSPEVILLVRNKANLEVEVCNGHFNPTGMFEAYDEDANPLAVGSPCDQVLAWMPMPEWDDDTEEANA